MAVIEERVSYLEAKMEEVGTVLGELKGLVLELDKKIDQRFMWLIGIQFAILIAIVAGLFGIVTRLMTAS
jgi:nitrate/nitrite-specific signal transduction histidine kinase